MHDELQEVSIMTRDILLKGDSYILIVIQYFHRVFRLDGSVSNFQSYSLLVFI
jgi:hypothetical protein